MFIWILNPKNDYDSKKYAWLKDIKIASDHISEYTSSVFMLLLMSDLDCLSKEMNPKGFHVKEGGGTYYIIILDHQWQFESV